MKTPCLLAVLGGIAVAAAEGLSSDARVAIDAQLHARALQDTAQPVRPGVPGQEPFWNGRAVQFLYAPAFEFPPTPGAKSYRFVVVPAAGDPLTFTATHPWAPLSPVWEKVAPGKARLTVQGLDARGNEVGPPRVRVFHRASVIAAQYPAPAMAWRESAQLALTKLVHSPDLQCWFTGALPAEPYHLYRYPAKIIGAAAAALATYAVQTPAPSDAAAALQAARRAADYLLSLSPPAEAAWAFHPPTYHPTLFQNRMTGHMTARNYMTTCGAEAGSYFLDVYAATHDAKYLSAAVRIAETYAKRQLPEGSWLLFVDPQEGRAVTDNVLIPTLVLEFLEKLARVAGDDRFDAVRQQALAWTMRHPVRTWNWQGQFEDVQPLPPYENLTKHEAGDLAIYLFQTAPGDTAKHALASDLVRFAEDQFVIWGPPPTASPKEQTPDGESGANPRNWVLPCVLEQYRCYAPVVASSAKMIRVNLAAYRATGDRLYLAKARALGSTLTHTQSHPKAPGRYQTWLMRNPGPMWFNCELLAIGAMQELAAADPRAP